MQVKFFRASCGARTAYATVGSGPPVVLLPRGRVILSCSGSRGGFGAYVRGWPLARRGGPVEQAIGERLVVSVRTVERRTLNIYAKLGVRSRAEAVAVGLHRSEQIGSA